MPAEKVSFWLRVSKGRTPGHELFSNPNAHKAVTSESCLELIQTGQSLCKGERRGCRYSALH